MQWQKNTGGTPVTSAITNVADSVPNGFTFTTFEATPGFPAAAPCLPLNTGTRTSSEGGWTAYPFGFEAVNTPQNYNYGANNTTSTVTFTNESGTATPLVTGPATVQTYAYNTASASAQVPSQSRHELNTSAGVITISSYETIEDVPGDTTGYHYNKFKFDIPSGVSVNSVTCYGSANIRPTIYGVSINDVAVYEGSSRTTLTFTNDTNLANFRVGDAVGGAGDMFSTTLYNGTGANLQITTGVDLTTQGGLVWLKTRTNPGSNYSHALIDTERGANSFLCSDRPVTPFSGGISSFNSNGYTLQAQSDSVNNSITNISTSSYVAWSFQKAPKFFDIQTFVGDGVIGRVVNHNLDTEPGMIIVKNYTGSDGNWTVYHKETGKDQFMNLDDTQIASTAPYWNNTEPTDTYFTLNNGNSVNGTGKNYVAYLFADEPGLIKCGGYTGSDSYPNQVVCGFEPQWVLIKHTTGGNNWVIFDNKRGDNKTLQPNDAGPEKTENGYTPTITGFELSDSASEYNQDGMSYIYVAIAASSTVTNINEAAKQMTFDGGSFDPLVNSSRQWSDNVSSNDGGFGSSEQPEMGFDGLPSTQCKCQQNDAIITITFNPAVTVSESLSLRYGGSAFGSGQIQIEANGSNVVDIPSSGMNGKLIDIPFTGSLTSLSVQEGNQNAGFSQIFVDGDVLMNGPWNTSKNWSASSGLDISSRGPVTLAFNGSIGDSVSQGITDNETIVIGTNITINTSLQYWSYNTSGQTTTWRFKRASDGDIAATTLNSGDKNDYDYTTVPLPTESGHGLGVEYSQISAQRSTSSEAISAIRLDGQVLVDPTTISVNEITGPTFPAATGTISSVGTTTVTEAIQTSTITNVGEVSPTITDTIQIASAIGQIIVQTGGSTVYSGAKTPAGLLGLNDYPDLWSPVNPNPNKNGSNQAAQFSMAVAEPLSITCIGSAPFKLLTASTLGGGGAYAYTITGDVTVTGTTGGSQGRYKELSDEVTITPNTSGATFTVTATQAFYINYVPLGGDTLLTLTDTTELALFTPGDVVQKFTITRENTTVSGQPTIKATFNSPVEVLALEVKNSPRSYGRLWGVEDANGDLYTSTPSGAITGSNYQANNTWDYSFNGNLGDGGAQNAQGVSYKITFDSPVPITSLYLFDNSDEFSASNLRITDASGTFDIYAADSIVSVTATNLATPSITTNGGSWTGSDGTSSGNIANRQTKVTGPVKTFDKDGPYITFSETTGRWLVTHSDYDADKKLDTKVTFPLVLNASNSAHVALFNTLNTRTSNYPTARQAFVDSLRTKIIGLTLTTPELEVLCGSSKSLIISQPTK